ncbi:MAG: coniferyl aldehyde dehydrogenase [SAR324 cluster bacterium]|nr:coniferyl aldehyde dehydrogenase [SAR324 cluster bacterium]
MNNSATIQPDVGVKIQEIFQAQKAAFTKSPYPSFKARIKDLKALKRQLQKYQDVLAEAISQDFDGRAVAESKMVDVMGSVFEINHALSHLKGWMAPARRSTELLFISNSIQVKYQPKGVVGVIVPWNFPLYLALGPMVAAMAAGNRVMVKMSELSPQTTRALKQILAQVFEESKIAVVGAELTDPNLFTALPFDHLIFTGSPNVGKTVMKTAAANLTPLTLELGGKSPAVVSRSASLHDAAKRLAHGKAFNAGQVCLSPDYAFVPKESLREFVSHIKAEFQKLYPTTESNEGYTSIISGPHFERLQDNLKDAEAKGAELIACGIQGKTRQMPLHLVIAPTEEMRILKEEIFGPLLPILTYETFTEVVDYINSHPRPLALYSFGHDKKERDLLLKNTHSGGVTINDWGWHAMNHDAPFGGIGNSGMGSYHGIEGFQQLSHGKTIFKKHRFFPVGLFYPPYTTWVQKFAINFFLGKADPNAKLNDD